MEVLEIRKNSQDVTQFVILVTKIEADLISGCCRTAHKNLPQGFCMQSTKSRLKYIWTKLNRELRKSN